MENGTGWKDLLLHGGTKSKRVIFLLLEAVNTTTWARKPMQVSSDTWHIHISFCEMLYNSSLSKHDVENIWPQ